MEDFSVVVSGLEYKIRRLIDIKSKLQFEVQEMKEELEFLREENHKLNDSLLQLTKEKQMLELLNQLKKQKTRKTEIE
jgi:FtsZ-binding cell division protein ZapB